MDARASVPTRPSEMGSVIRTDADEVCIPTAAAAHHQPRWRRRYRPGAPLLRAGRPRKQKRRSPAPQPAATCSQAPTLPSDARTPGRGTSSKTWDASPDDRPPNPARPSSADPRHALHRLLITHRNAMLQRQNVRQQRRRDRRATHPLRIALREILTRAIRSPCSAINAKNDPPPRQHRRIEHPHLS